MTCWSPGFSNLLEHNITLSFFWHEEHFLQIGALHMALCMVHDRRVATISTNFIQYFCRDLQKGTETAMEDIVTVESGNDINHSLALTEWLICFLCFLRILTVGSIRTPFVSRRGLLRIQNVWILGPDQIFFLNSDPDPVSSSRFFGLEIRKNLKWNKKFKKTFISFFAYFLL